jgi:K+-transporting ATPase ATPase A chain
MSYLTQMAGLAHHNFVSAAVGIAIAVAVIRGVAWKESKTLGNFWVDTTRGLLWVLFADMPGGRAAAGVAGSGAEP